MAWDNVDFKYNRIYIEKCAYYETDIGIYIGVPKTKQSIRYIKLPVETMELINQYKKQYYEALRIACGSAWTNSNFVFMKDGGANIWVQSCNLTA